MSPFFSQRLVASPDAVAQSVGGETVLLHIPSERFVSLDDIATAMWETATAAPSLDAAVSTLLEEFDAERSQIEGDLQTFVETVTSLELATLVPGA